MDKEIGISGIITCKDIKHSKENGCSTCGGYGHVYARSHCPSCKKSGYFRPGAYTLYEGKRYKSMDGLRMVARMNADDICEECHEKE